MISNPIPNHLWFYSLYGTSQSPWEMVSSITADPVIADINKWDESKNISDSLLAVVFRTEQNIRKGKVTLNLNFIKSEYRNNNTSNLGSFV